jgi:hypothetical protein
MSAPQPLQAVADLLQLYVEHTRSRMPDVPTVDQWCEVLLPESAELARRVGTTPLELAYLLHTSAFGHVEAAALCLRTQSADTAFSVLTLFRTVLEASATAWWLCEGEQSSKEGLRRLAALRCASDLLEVGRGRERGDAARAEAAEASVQALRDRASTLGLGKLTVPSRTALVTALLGPESLGTYDFLSGLAHAEPADVHHLISFAAEREGGAWSRGVAVASAVMLLTPLRAHGRAFARFLEVAGGASQVLATQRLEELLGAIATAVNRAAPAHW